jgi:capsular exopolysaccharide synthesis family protein
MKNLFPGANGQAGSIASGSLGAAMTLRDVFVLLRRHAFLILVGTCIGTATALALALKAEPRYTATAMLVIDPAKAPISEISPAAPSLGIDLATITTQLNIILSRQHMARVIEDLDLGHEPAFWQPEPASEEGFLAGLLKRTGLAALAEPVSGRLPPKWLASTGFADSPPEKLDSREPPPAIAALAAAVPKLPQPPMEMLIDAFSGSFSAKQDGDSRVIKVRFTSTDPELAAKVVNRVVELYVDVQLKDKLARAAKISAWIGERLATVAEDVRRSEDALEAYRARQSLNSAAGAEAAHQEQAEINRELAVARADLADRRSKVELVKRMRGTGGTDAVLGIVDSPLLLGLREQEQTLIRQEGELAASFGARHPRMLLIQAEQRRIRETIGREVARLAADLERQAELAATRLSQLEAQAAALQARDYRQGAAEVGLRELEREVQANQQIYQLFLEHSKEIGAQTQIIEPDARIISRANPPERQSSLSPRLFALLGFTISFSGSALLALLIEGLNRRVHSARQLERLFGLKVLDVVPRLGSQGQGRQQIGYLKQKPFSAYAEALRSIHTTVHLSNPDGPPRVVMVGSALSGEGKTTFAVGLATTAAQWGQRVLLLDLDLRHPCIARLTAEPQKGGGLMEFLSGRRTLADSIERTEGGFDCLGLHQRPDNPTSLLGGATVRQLIEELRAGYDLVVIDSPPVLAVTDSRIIASLADKVVFVCHWRQTTLSAVQRAVQILRDARADICGMVLLQVNSRKYLLFDNEDGSNYYGKIKKYYVE